ncbi:Phosphotransferase enzyme family protein [Promicromonospora thailandica]|uniref:Phosphotransferase enzyme family protein n=2 Tax=Promicromonospora thailandica TaxID=765201 RepID=A0A9X2FX09_9MICO|nr:phosphotransferase [Promicromonospora thailandica]MCP2262852.1 Phosphotransferase enzyme family protein [Promicromonospora thailandica]
MRRSGWNDLPPALRARINHLLGARVIASSVSGDSGVLPGAQIQVQTSQGNAFVKALGAAGQGPLDLLRQEIALNPLLPPEAPGPELLWSVDEELPGLGSWVAVGYRMRSTVRPIDLSWPEDDVAALVRAVRSIGEIQAPDDPMFLPEEKTFPTDAWETLADRRPAGLAKHSPWLAGRLEGLAEIATHAPEAIAGTGLQHGLLRVQNVLLPLAPDEAPLVTDWIRGGAGAPFLDLVAMLLHVRVHGGPPPEATLRRYGLPPGTDQDAVTCWIAVLAGHYVRSSLEPPPPEMPEVRAAEHRLARAAVAWLQTRLGY